MNSLNKSGHKSLSVIRYFSTTRATGGRQPGARFGYRLSRLEDKVNALIEKLMKDNCRSHPCQNGGTCFSMYETFKCDCPSNWEGPTCGQDVNECARFAGIFINFPNFQKLTYLKNFRNGLGMSKWG